MSNYNSSDKEFERLLSASIELGSAFQEGLIFIGGIAVYLHAINNPKTKDLAESTHDADFYISMADMADLRDLEEVTANRRLSKHQLIKRGFEFDIYTEKYSSLVVPYDAVSACSFTYDGIRVASLEHLLVLKLEAYRDRRESSKGQKDAKDIIRIGLVSNAVNKKLEKNLIVGYLSDHHLELLKQIERGPEFLAMAKGNAKLAKEFRDNFGKSIREVY